MTTTLDTAKLEEHLNDLILRRAPVEPTASAMSALSVALRFANGREIEAILTLSRHQQDALRQLTAH